VPVGTLLFRVVFETSECVADVASVTTSNTFKLIYSTNLITMEI